MLLMLGTESLGPIGSSIKGPLGGGMSVRAGMCVCPHCDNYLSVLNCMAWKCWMLS